jgi:TRAP-type C4-dicarboxylate transport system permease small subunit
MMSLIQLSDAVNALVEALIAILAMFFTLLLVVSVFSRYVFDISIVEGVELVRLSFLWAVFLAASTAAKRRAHVRITFLLTPLSRSGRAIVLRLADLVVVAFGAVILWYGWEMTARVSGSFLPTLQISQSWLYGALPVCGGLIVFHAIAGLTVPLPERELTLDPLE